MSKTKRIANSEALTKASMIIFEKPSLTVKSAAYDTDINNMVKGLAPFSQSSKTPFYIDERIFPDSLEQQFNVVQDALDAFDTLPPEIRAEFDNDPRVLASRLASGDREALITLGVIKDSSDKGLDEVAPQNGKRNQARSDDSPSGEDSQ